MFEGFPSSHVKRASSNELHRCSQKKQQEVFQGKSRDEAKRELTCIQIVMVVHIHMVHVHAHHKIHHDSHIGHPKNQGYQESIPPFSNDRGVIQMTPEV